MKLTLISSLSLVLSITSLVSGDFPVESDPDICYESKGPFPYAEYNNATLTLKRRVINGEDALQEDWPFLVALLKPSHAGYLESRQSPTQQPTSQTQNHSKRRPFSGFSWAKPAPKLFKQHCGASLIAPNVLLTAGHCVVDHDNKLVGTSEILARIGAYQLSTALYDDNVDDVEIEQIFVRDGFDVNHLVNGNDIALLKLKRPVKSSPTITPAALPPAGLKYPTGTQCVSAGWGNTETGYSSDYPLEVDVPVYDMRKCSQTWHLPKTSQDGRIICAIDPKWSEDTCYGDSGGPLVCRLPEKDPMAIKAGVAGKWVLSGLVSFGSSKCAEEGVPGMYTSVAYHVPWILDVIAKING